MIDRDAIFQERVDFLKNQLQSIRTDFSINLKPKILSFECQPLTRLDTEIIQGEIDQFLERNKLRISVYAHLLSDRIVIVGRTIIDELVWEQIQL